ncbi:hypothetical protein ABMB44_14820 [Levilactobacillus brevis]
MQLIALRNLHVKGYTADKAQIDKQTVNGDSKDLAFTVTYTKNAPNDYDRDEDS